MRKKIAFVGAGHVGATAAQLCAYKELGDVVLVDIVEGVPQGKALDMTESAPIEGFDANVVGTNDYKDMDGADVVVVTAGIPRKPGMSREDLLNTNAKIMTSVMENVKAHAPDAIVIIVSNPLDAMCHVAKKVSGLNRNKIIGMAGVLDSARMRSFISMELNVSMEDVQAMVLGLHGDDMVPLPRYSVVSGIAITELMNEEQINRINERTKKGGGEIVALLKTGSAYYAPGSSIIEMVESIVKDKKRLLPCAVELEGEYGINGIFMGVPVKLGANGVEGIVELKVTEEESASLKKSAESVEHTLSLLNG